MSNKVLSTLLALNMSSEEPHAYRIPVTLNERETVTILPMLGKLNASLQQRFCQATFSEDSSQLVLSYRTEKDHKFAMETLEIFLQFNLEEPTIKPTGKETSEERALATAEIELDGRNLEFATNNMEEINDALAKKFCHYTYVSHGTKGNLQLHAPDSETIKSAFEFIRSGLKDVRDRVNRCSPNSDSELNIPLSQSPTRSDSDCSIEVKKWIIPGTLYELCTHRIDAIFRENDCEYVHECTTSGNVILEYTCNSSSLAKIKPELENIVNQFQTLTRQTAPPSHQSSAPKLDSPSRTSGHFSYQEGTDDPSHTSHASTETGVSQSVGQVGFPNFVVPETNPFFEDLNPNIQVPRDIPSTQTDLRFTPPDLVSETQELSLLPITQSTVRVVPNTSDYSPINSDTFLDNYSQRSHESNSLTKKGNATKSRENSLSAALKQKATPHPSHPVSTGRGNDLQPMNMTSQISPDTATSQIGRYNDTPHQDMYSHQFLEPIIQYDNKYACVVVFSKDTWYTEAKFLEQTLLGLKIIQCQNQTRVCTLIADQREMVKCGLKELNKKFGRLGYLPPCNGIPIMTTALNSIVELDNKPKQSKSVQTLASLTCSSGLSIDIKSMSFSEGSWDAVVKSVEQDTIQTIRQHGHRVLDVVGPGTRAEEGKRLAESAYRLEYWYFYVTENRGVSKQIIHLVIPSWNPNNFKPNSLKESIASILSYCNTHSIQSIAFPIIGHESRKIPIPLSAQALLRGIDEFSSHAQSPSLKQVDIVITNKSCIRSFQYHFVTPIQRHLKAPSEDKKVVTSESAEEEEETCPICLEGLHSEGQAVRKLTQCKHEFHEQCIIKAIESNPRCPLCMSALGVQRGNQPQGGRMTHDVLFHPLPGYPNDGTIKIHYSIPGGRQNESHPNPGEFYPSTSRTAFLPDNAKGKKVLSLLQVAFDRGLIFTVGTSRTLGMDNMVTWNDIHHKTTQYGAAHGYPDPGYLDRVIAELKDKGVE